VREIIQTTQFKRDFKKIAASGRYKKQDFLDVTELLVNDIPLPEKYRDHALMNNWKDYRECHIKPDWLLIYKKYDTTLLLARTGSHSELF
jgi:mRNA interferase YafQ